MEKEYDLIVIGGGPAGMIAGGRAAEKGANVLLIDKNDRLGVKLLITGKGRCNVTNAEFDNRVFADKFGKNGKFLLSPLSFFGVKDVMAFFKKRGLPMKIERGDRVFPQSDKSTSVVKVLEKYLRDGGVDVRLKTKAKSIVIKNKKIEKIILSNKKELKAKNYLISTGGQSHPETGSNGCAYVWLEEMGHNIIEPRPALVPVLVKENVTRRLEGLSLKNVEISLYHKGKKKTSRFGEALFTYKGLSGPIVLDMSREVGEFLNSGDLKFVIDFKPALSYEILDKRIQRDFNKFGKKMLKNSLGELSPNKLIPVIIWLSGIHPEKKVNTINKEERTNLVKVLKEFTLEIEDLDGFKKAIVTAGGVDLKEIDFKTMKSKLISNLYIAGEVLDFDGPTGGFNLQACWSTGYVAGSNVVDKKEK
jgi:predicted Rossmann fold flavoprotein